MSRGRTIAGVFGTVITGVLVWGVYSNASASDTERIKQQIEAGHREFMEQAAQNSATPLLAPDQRALWIEAWHEMQACAEGIGMGDHVSDVSPSFGDGETPLPYVDLGNAETGRELISRCPLDLSSLDLPALEAAMNEAQAEAAARNPQPQNPKLTDEEKARILESRTEPSPELLAQAEQALKANDPELYNSFPDSASRQEYIKSEMDRQFREALEAEQP